MTRKRISTLQGIQDRCQISDLTDCWIWKGATNKYGVNKEIPVMAIDGYPSPKTVYFAVMHFLRKTPVNGELVWKTCDTKCCVNPKHLMKGTKAEMGAWTSEFGRQKNNPRYIISNRKNARVKSKITMEIAREIRKSEATNKVLAETYGVSADLIRKVRSGHYWKETMLPGASIFNSASILG